MGYNVLVKQTNSRQQTIQINSIQNKEETKALLIIQLMNDFTNKNFQPITENRKLCYIEAKL